MQTSFLHLVAAVFVGFVLAHMVTKYFEKFERFPAPLVTPGPGVPAMVQGRDFIPYRTLATAPPGPQIPWPTESDATARETAPPLMPPSTMSMSTMPPAPTPIAQAAALAAASTKQPTTELPWAMTNDDYYSFLVPVPEPTKAA